MAAADRGRSLVLHSGVRLGSSWLISLSISLLASSEFWHLNPPYLRVGILVFAICVLQVPLLVLLRVRRRVRSEVYRDEKCAVEMVNMLREILPIVAEEECWGTVKTAGYRLRFRRFRIGVEDF